MFCPKDIDTSSGINMDCCMCMNDKKIYQYHLHLLEYDEKTIASKNTTNGSVIWGRNGHCKICASDKNKLNKGKHYHLKEC